MHIKWLEILICSAFTGCLVKGGHIIRGPFSLKYKCININEEKIYNLWIKKITIYSFQEIYS